MSALTPFPILTSALLIAARSLLGIIVAPSLVDLSSTRFGLATPLRVKQRRMGGEGSVNPCLRLVAAERPDPHPVDLQPCGELGRGIRPPWPAPADGQVEQDEHPPVQRPLVPLRVV